MISRRNLLVGGGVLAASTAFVKNLVWADPPAPAIAWPEANFDRAGELDSVAPDPAWGGPKKILEIFLVGGLSHYESFFVDRRFITNAAGGGGVAPSSLLDEFQTTTITAACGAGGRSDTHVFNAGTPGQRMEWSIGTAPLWGRADILARTRVVAMTHGATVFNGHPTARPYALTGRRIGDPRAASLGAAMKRRYPGQHTSYILMPDRSRFFAADLPGFDAWLATGNHGPVAQPVLIPMGADSAPALATWATRGTVPRGTDANDALTRFYMDRYDQNLPHPPDGALAHRYKGFEAYRAAFGSLHDSPELAAVFGSSLRNAGPVAFDCSNHVPEPAMMGKPNTTQSSLDMAAWLFRHMNSRYVGMFDVGIGTDTTSPYDGHHSSAGVTYGNLYRLLTMLSAFIAPSGTAPAENQISLDDTMIILNTEFGRTPYTGAAPGQRGRDHYGAGYATVLIGGPIRPTSTSTPRMVGQLTTTGGATSVVGTYTPANLAWVGLEAAGIWPEHADNFAFSDRPPIPATATYANPAAAFFNAT